MTDHRKYGTQFLESELVLAASADDAEHVEALLQDPEVMPTLASLSAFYHVLEALQEAITDEKVRRRLGGIS